MTDTVTAYDTRAGEFAAQYESVSAETVHRPLAEFIPRGSDLLALDIGAGSGRDAAWLGSLGYDVVAAEPSHGMRTEGRRLHAGRPIRWIDDRLPDLCVTHRLGLAFDLILLSAVWMHVPPPARPRAFRKLATLLKPGGVILMTLREGPSEPDRPMWAAPVGEIEALARGHGLSVLRSAPSGDQLNRPDVRWTAMCLRLPDDGAGALPLLRGIILNDNKASTYKLALLRAVARIADTAPALAVPHAGEDAVDVPLGLVALNWVRMYLPLVAAGLPQMPGNGGPEGLGFAGPGFRQLLAARYSAQDLRIGATFADDRAALVAQAIAEAGKTIARMPANFIRFTNSDARVFTAALASAPRVRGGLTLDRETLAAFGVLTVPGHVWRTMQRLGAWVEPVLVTEWVRLVRAYGERMGRPMQVGEVEAALAWLDPERDTALARTVVKQLLDAGHRITCVWSGARLGSGTGTGTIDIDHCLPWSAWPCGDLWNLMPTSRRVNQHLKRDRLPSAAALSGARENIINWWETAWRADPALLLRFERESVAALPIEGHASPENVFAGLEWRRLRLRQDQQVREWDGVPPVGADAYFATSTCDL